MRPHRLWQCGQYAQRRRRDASASRAACRGGPWRSFSWDGHGRSVYSRSLQLRPAGIRLRFAAVVAAPPAPAARRSAGTARRSPRGRESCPAARAPARRAPSARRPADRRRCTSQRSSSSDSAGSADVVLAGSHVEVERRPAPGSGSRPLDMRREGQLQVQPAGGGLQLEPRHQLGRALPRSSARRSSAAPAATRGRSCRTSPGSSRMLPQIDHRPTTVAVEAGRARPGAPRRATPAARARAARRPGTCPG